MKNFEGIREIFISEFEDIMFNKLNSFSDNEAKEYNDCYRDRLYQLLKLYSLCFDMTFNSSADELNRLALEKRLSLIKENHV